MSNPGKRLTISEVRAVTPGTPLLFHLPHGGVELCCVDEVTHRPDGGIQLVFDTGLEFFQKAGAWLGPDTYCEENASTKGPTFLLWPPRETP